MGRNDVIAPAITFSLLTLAAKWLFFLRSLFLVVGVVVVVIIVVVIFKSVHLAEICTFSSAF